MEDLQLYSIREIIANERALKYVNCISFTEAVINSVRSGGYYKPERTPEIAERELYQLLINNETLTTDYNQAINAINEGRLVTFHVLEDLDFANYKYPKQPWLNISNHNGVIAPQELQIARIPTFEDLSLSHRYFAKLVTQGVLFLET